MKCKELTNNVFRCIADLNMQPWQHAYIHNGKAFIFNWDTRELASIQSCTCMNLQRANDSYDCIKLNGKELQFADLMQLVASIECDVTTAQDTMPMSDSANINLAPPVTYNSELTKHKRLFDVYDNRKQLIAFAKTFDEIEHLIDKDVTIVEHKFNMQHKIS